MTTDLARVQNLILEAGALTEKAADLIFKLCKEPDVPKNVVYNNRPKLTKRDVLLIRQMKRNGEKQAAIAVTFDCHPATISRIVRGIYH